MAVGASNIPDKANLIPVHELTEAEVKEVVKKFVDAAVRAQKAGFDGVEIHGAHGYLLTNFFSNTATLLVVSSLVSALSGPLVDAGYDITILAVAISLSSMVAYLTYASSGQAAILLSQKNMDNKFIWTYGIAAMLLYAAVVILVSAVCLFF